MPTITISTAAPICAMGPAAPSMAETTLATSTPPPPPLASAPPDTATRAEPVAATGARRAFRLCANFFMRSSSGLVELLTDKPERERQGPQQRNSATDCLGIPNRQFRQQ